MSVKCQGSVIRLRDKRVECVFWKAPVNEEVTVSLCSLDIRTNQTFGKLAIKNLELFLKNAPLIQGILLQNVFRCWHGTVVCRDLQGRRNSLLPASYYSSHASRFRWLRSTQVRHSKGLLQSGEKEWREGGSKPYHSEKNAWRTLVEPCRDYQGDKLSCCHVQFIAAKRHRKHCTTSANTISLYVRNTDILLTNFKIPIKSKKGAIMEGKLVSTFTC